MHHTHVDNDVRVVFLGERRDAQGGGRELCGVLGKLHGLVAMHENLEEPNSDDLTRVRHEVLPCIRKHTEVTTMSEVRHTRPRARR